MSRVLCKPNGEHVKQNFLFLRFRRLPSITQVKGMICPQVQARFVLDIRFQSTTHQKRKGENAACRT